MARRVGLGPVFFFEWLTTARRWQMYAWRALFLLLLLAALWLVWLSEAAQVSALTIGRLADVGEHFFYALIGTQLSLVLLAAPAATAGAICLDKARGSLIHLLVTDLSDAEIVLGKLAARLLPVLGMVLSALPVLLLSAFLGGIDPEALLGAFLVTLGVAVLGCSLALTVSIWGHKTHEVLMVVYGIWAVVLLAYPTWDFLDGFGTRGLPPTWLKQSNPFWLAFAPYATPGTATFGDCLEFLGGTLGMAAGLIVLAVARVRSVIIRQAGRPPRPLPVPLPRRSLRAWLPSPSLDANPVLWREWHRQRPSRWIRGLWLLYAVLALLFSLLTYFCILTISNKGRDMAPWVNGLQVAIGLLFVCVISSTTLVEERTRGSLDVLLTTPLSTAQIVWGKWWGAYRYVPLLAILPGFLLVPLILREGHLLGLPVLVGLILAYGAALTSLGLALSTWIARQGLAIALSMALYVGISVGWMFMVMELFIRDLGEGLAVASPFFGVGQLTAVLDDRSDYEKCLSWYLTWIVTYLVIAVVLGVLTWATFDHCLGRAAQKPWPPERPRSRSASPPALAAEPASGTSLGS